MAPTTIPGAIPVANHGMAVTTFDRPPIRFLCASVLAFAIVTASSPAVFIPAASLLKSLAKESSPRDSAICRLIPSAPLSEFATALPVTAYAVANVFESASPAGDPRN